MYKRQINSNGTILFKAEKVGSETLLSQIVDFVKMAQSSRAPIQDLTDKISGCLLYTSGLYLQSGESSSKRGPEASGSARGDGSCY